MSHELFFTALKRYTRALLLNQPTGHLYAVLRPTLEGSTDAELAELLAAAPFKRFLQPLPDGRTWIADFSRGAALPGTSPAATLTELERLPDGGFRVTVIHANGMPLTPANGRAWALAKAYVLQGAAAHLILAAAA
jgi:hypothetical protein